MAVPFASYRDLMRRLCCYQHGPAVVRRFPLRWLFCWHQSPECQSIGVNLSRRLSISSRSFSA
jgi:hypothetical protein